MVQLSPHFVRVTFKDAALARFGYAGGDQRVKILLPRPGRTLADLPTGHDWYLRWRHLPPDIRPTMRTYTVRAYRPGAGELDVDFVLHGQNGEQPGPLSTWAATAQPGSEVALLGPDRPGTGRMWGAEWCPPENTSKVLLAGDETAIPAIAAILEDLPAHLTGIALTEVPEPSDALALTRPPSVDVRWLVRRRSHTQAARGVLLEDAVNAALSTLRGPTRRDRSWTDTDDDQAALLWDVPEGGRHDPGDLYVWMAGEASVMKRLRRLARQDHALPKSAVACMGYWRQGQSEPL